MPDLAIPAHRAKPYLWVAKRQLGLLDKARTNTVTEGVAASGEVSAKGTVSETEDWEGRVAVDARPSTIRYIKDSDGRIRPMTMNEMIERGYFIVGKGPHGFQN